MYKILKILQRLGGSAEFTTEMISASALGLSFHEWEQLLISMQDDGLITGLVVKQTLSDAFPHIVEPIRPRLTIKGREYLEENSAMKKAKAALEVIGWVIP